MKTPSILIFVLLLGADQGKAALLIEEGQSYTLNFSGLPFISNHVERGYTIMGAFHFSDNNPVNPGERFLIEFFKDNTSQPRFLADDFTYTGAYALVGRALGPNNNSAWSDLQGAVRFTMLAGSTQLDSIEIQVGTPTALFGEIFIVPEPHFSAIAVLGLITFLARRCQKTGRIS